MTWQGEIHGATGFEHLRPLGVRGQPFLRESHHGRTEITASVPCTSGQAARQESVGQTPRAAYKLKNFLCLSPMGVSYKIIQGRILIKTLCILLCAKAV